MQEAIASTEQAADEHIAEREAAGEDVSMNQWVVQKLAGGQPTGLFDL
ncbi:toxin-antitoxin system HicB family antitoxin [Mycobacterium sp.]